MKTLEERFFEKVGEPHPVTGCKEWIGWRDRDGYGKFRVGKKKTGAHRAAWFVIHGKWPEKLIMHRCDNPGCVAPDHLQEGTHLDNVQDCVVKGRRRDGRGEKHPSVKLTQAQVLEIRQAVGAVHQELARHYRVSSATICDIVSRRTWRHI